MDNLFFRRVLLVEDEGLTRSAMKRLILSSEPALDIDEAGSYDEAVERLQRDAYELIFLDYQPGRPLLAGLPRSRSASAIGP
ncbi:response regulator transcription factor [Paraburkholderia youngii]|uniref:response regulator transcription factor n=1 Tax=Paraburkholderia youngii TaxID=2782701 RepID=UPI003D211958